jgi:enoyl-CoA hydratase/carnithine racemase
VASGAAEPAVLYRKEQGGRVAIVTLNRPRVLNAYDVAMRDGLYEALLAVRDDPEVRVLVLAGNGRAFSTGGDLAEFGTAPSPVGAREIRWRRDVWGLLWSLPQITVAAVHGLAVGGGFEMAMLCDQCWAAAGARFALPETGLGMIPGVAGTQTLARLVGLGRALDVVLSGRWIDSPEALRLGLVGRVFPRRGFARRVLREASAWARLDAEVVSRLKRSVKQGLDISLAEGLALERRLGSSLPSSCPSW